MLGTIGVTPSEALLRGEAGRKFGYGLGAFVYGEKRVRFADPWRANWDAGVGFKYTF